MALSLSGLGLRGGVDLPRRPRRAGEAGHESGAGVIAKELNNTAEKPQPVSQARVRNAGVKPLRTTAASPAVRRSLC